MRRAILVMALAFGACGPPTNGGDGGLDSGRDAGVDAGPVDAGLDAGLDAGTDAGTDAGEPPDAGAWLTCVEAEDAGTVGTVERWLTTVVPAPSRAGGVRFAFTLPEPRAVSLWARVRAPTHSRNSLNVRFDGEDAGVEATWDIPVTPVLRWQRVTRRGPTGTFWRADQSTWPGALDAGLWTIQFDGVEPGVELDALCAGTVEPAERFPAPPSHPTVRLATGLVANGVLDESAALQSALNAVLPGETLQLPPGRIRFTTGLTLTTSDVTIRGADSGTVLFADLPDAGLADGLALIGLGEFVGTPLAVDAPAYAHELALDGGAFAVGDIVTVTSDDWGGPAPNVVWPFFRFRMAYAQVTAVRSGPTLTLDRPLLSAFSTVSNARVAKFRGLTNVVLEHFTVEGPQPAGPDNNLIAVSRCARCFFVDLTLLHARQSGLELAFTLDAQVVRPTVRDVVDTGGGGHGYGVAVTRSQGAVVRDGWFGGVLRHGVPVSWGARESFIFRNVFDRRVVQPVEKLGSIDIHGEDDYANLVEANLVLQGDPGVVVGGGGTTHGNDGPWNVVRDNRFEDVTDGVAVYKQTFNTVIERNRVLRPTRYGVRVESGSADTFAWNNEVAQAGLAGVMSRDSDRLDVRGNALDARSGTAVQILDGGGYSVIDNALDGGRVQHPDSGTVSQNR